jgi:hypothetical protein
VHAAVQNCGVVPRSTREQAFRVEQLQCTRLHHVIQCAVIGRHILASRTATAPPPPQDHSDDSRLRLNWLAACDMAARARAMRPETCYGLQYAEVST